MQHVKYFRGKLLAGGDNGLAKLIEEYAQEMGYHIDSISYALNDMSSHALVVFTEQIQKATAE
jgi:hypothetical protein